MPESHTLEAKLRALVAKWKEAAEAATDSYSVKISKLTLDNCADELEALLAERQESPLVDKLAEHWLSRMDCDHNMKRDRAVCCCGFVTIWEPTVGDAAKAWAEHALAAAAEPSSGTGERK